MQMPEQVTLTVNGKPVVVPNGATVAVAMATVGTYCRDSVSGERRTILCAMGSCFECRVEIEGKPHQRACQILCSPGMRVNTQPRIETGAESSR